MIHHSDPQGSDAWLAARRGVVTASRFRDKLATVAPDLVARVGRRAEAYQLRYLARRAAMNGEGPVALRLVVSSLRLYPGIVREEPKRTLVTAAFAGLAVLMPRQSFERLKLAMFQRLARQAAPAR